MQIVDPSASDHREPYILELFRLRQRRGVTLQEAETLINDRNVFGSMMVHMGDADALVSGRDSALPRHHSSGAADRAHARGPAPRLRLLRHDYAQRGESSSWPIPA